VTAVAFVALLIGMLLLAIAVNELQARLERWDYRRHAED
jgi:hypothetical protein